MLHFDEKTIQEKAKLTIDGNVYCLEQNSDRFIRLTSDNLVTQYCLIYAFDVYDSTQIFEINDDSSLTFLDEIDGWCNVEEIGDYFTQIGSDDWYVVPSDDVPYHYENLIEHIVLHID